MNYNKADFIASYGISSQLPESDRPELSFSGRSNVGKSSLINKLCNRKNLARVSSTPGKTATINFYAVDDCYFVDLPGYGYAKVSNADRERWDDLINSYFEAQRRHTLLVQLIDCRHAPSADDIQMLQYLHYHNIPFVVALTKADKAMREARQACVRLAPRRHAEDAPGEPAQTSLLPEPDAPAFALPEPLYAQDGTVFLQELPAALLTPLRAVQAPLQAWLEDNPEADAHPQMLELYFTVQDLVRAAERYDSHFVTQLTARGSELELQLLCLDPAPFVDASLSTGRSAALFSATLTPPAYYRSVLGCADARAVALESPFPAGNLGLFCLPGISTRYRDRERSVQSVSDALARLAQSRVGNYLAFFPSYAYLRQVQEDFAARYPGISTLVQESGLDDAARAAFLARFEPDPAHTLLGFAVMGGIFGEGVDLAGDRLIGCAIVGVGLPQVNPRQEMLRRYYDAQNGAGFDYAYRYPGMNKVLQAAGRVIRTPEDKGVVLLLDDRFAKPDYQRLFPLHWKHLQYLPGPAALETALADFWSSKPE